MSYYNIFNNKVVDPSEDSTASLALLEDKLSDICFTLCSGIVITPSQVQYLNHESKNVALEIPNKRDSQDDDDEDGVDYESPVYEKTICFQFQDLPLKQDGEEKTLIDEWFAGCAKVNKDDPVSRWQRLESDEIVKVISSNLLAELPLTVEEAIDSFRDLVEPGDKDPYIPEEVKPWIEGKNPRDKIPLFVSLLLNPSKKRGDASVFEHISGICEMNIENASKTIAFFMLKSVNSYIKSDTARKKLFRSLHALLYLTMNNCQYLQDRLIPVVAFNRHLIEDAILKADVAPDDVHLAVKEVSIRFHIGYLLLSSYLHVYKLHGQRTSTPKAVDIMLPIKLEKFIQGENQQVEKALEQLISSAPDQENVEMDTSSSSSSSSSSSVVEEKSSPQEMEPKAEQKKRIEFKSLHPDVKIMLSSIQSYAVDIFDAENIENDSTYWLGNNESGGSNLDRLYQIVASEAVTINFDDIVDKGAEEKDTKVTDKTKVANYLLQLQEVLQNKKKSLFSASLAPSAEAPPAQIPSTPQKAKQGRNSKSTPQKSPNKKNMRK